MNKPYTIIHNQPQDSCFHPLSHYFVKFKEPTVHVPHQRPRGGVIPRGDLSLQDAGESGHELLQGYEALEGAGELLVVARQGGLAMAALGVGGHHHVVELGRADPGPGS